MLMQGLDYVIIAAFFALMFGIAAACSRRRRAAVRFVRNEGRE